VHAAGDAGDLPALLAAAQQDLDAALIAGRNTARIRVEIAQLRRQIADAADAEAAKAAEAERGERERITSAASAIAAGATERLAVLLVDLQPPPWPLAA